MQTSTQHEFTPLKGKVAIVGKCPLTMNLAPFKDETYEIWGSNDIYNYIPRVDVIFQLHERKRFEAFYRDKDHLETLKTLNIPIICVQQWEDLPTSIAYPWKEIISVYGDYLTNSISEMIAFALHHDYKQIALFGCDLISEREQRTQLASVCHYLGIAIGLKIARGYPILYIPPESPLLKALFVYGRDGSATVIDKLIDYKNEYLRMTDFYAKQEREARDNSFKNLGAQEAINKILNEHGGYV